MRIPGEDGEVSAEDLAQIQETLLSEWLEKLLAKYEEFPLSEKDRGNNGGLSRASTWSMVDAAPEFGED
jgi:hypothetical protein